MVDDHELVGIKVQQEAVEGTLKPKSLHTVTVVIHEEYSPCTIKI